MRLETDAMGDELKILRIPVMMAATDVAAIDEWRRKQADLPSRSEAIRQLLELGKGNDGGSPRWSILGFIGLAFRQNRYGAAADERNHDGDIEANGK